MTVQKPLTQLDSFYLLSQTTAFSLLLLLVDSSRPPMPIHNYKERERPKSDLDAKSGHERASIKQYFLMTTAKICQL